VALVVTLIAHGCPLQASVAAFGFDERTVAAWLTRAGLHSQAVHEHLVQTPRDLGQVQADEIRVKKQGGSVWMALAIMVSTRVWLGGEVSEPRDLSLIRRLIERVRACALVRRILCCTEGVSAYVRAIRETFRTPVYTGTRGRPRLRSWPQLLIAQVVTRDEKRRVVAVDRRITHGSPAHGRAGAGGLPRRWRHQHGLYRAPQCHLPRAALGTHTPRASTGTHDPHARAWDVPDRNGLELLHDAREPASGDDGEKAGRRPHPRNGCGDYRSSLECSRVALASCSATAMDAPKAARPPIACTAMPD
jgi:hypothetical protein